MNPRTYESPAAFKRALEDRIKAGSKTGVDFARRRQLLVFDRFLARVAATFGDAAILKGGLVLELRLERARTTKDIDLRLQGQSDDVLPKLRAAGQLDLGDFMAFEVGRTRTTPRSRATAFGTTASATAPSAGSPRRSTDSPLASTLRSATRCWAKSS